jgi:hypothetical protein
LPSGSRGGLGAALGPSPAARSGHVHRDTVKKQISETTDTGGVHSQTLELNRDPATLPTSVTISLGVTFKPFAGFTSPFDKAFIAFKTRVFNAAKTWMDSKFKVHCKGNNASQPDRDLPITFRLDEIPNGMEIQCWGGTHGISEVKYKPASGGNPPDSWMNLYELGQAGETSLPDVTMAHELGHALLGASDEHANVVGAPVPNRKVTNDNSIMGDLYTRTPGKDPVVNPNVEFKARHFATIAVPVGTMLPGSTCTIVK